MSVGNADGRGGGGGGDGGGGGGGQELEINICGKSLLVVGHHDKQVLLCTSLSLKLPSLHNRPLYYYLSVTTFDFGRDFAEISFLMKLPLETGAENSKFQVKLSELS